MLMILADTDMPGRVKEWRGGARQVIGADAPPSVPDPCYNPRQVRLVRATCLVAAYDELINDPRRIDLDRFKRTTERSTLACHALSTGGSL